MFLYPTGYFPHEGHKGLLQPLLRTRTAVFAAGRPLWSVPQKGYPALDEEQSLSLWLSDLFLRHVFSDVVEHLPGFRRCGKPQAGGNAAVDIQAPLAMGLSRHPFSPRRCAVCLRLLQRDAHLYCVGANHHDSVQASQLVRVLPDGNYDPVDLQSKAKHAGHAQEESD